MKEELNFSLNKMDDAATSAEDCTERYIESLNVTDQAMNALEKNMSATSEAYQTIINNYKMARNKLIQAGEFMKEISLIIRNKQIDLEDKTAYLNNNIE